MKFGIPWGAKEDQPQKRTPDAVHVAASEPFLAPQASIVPEFEDDAGARKGTRSDSRRLGGMTGRFDIEKAIAEISARRIMLDAEPPVMPSAGPTPDLSGLESHLRKITEQIEALRRSGVEDAIEALRSDVKEIARRLTATAWQSTESLAVEPHGSGVRLEQALADIRD